MCEVGKANIRDHVKAGLAQSAAGAQVMCEVSKADIQDHVAERLEREAAEKERRRKEKLEAHLYLQVAQLTRLSVMWLLRSRWHEACLPPQGREAPAAMCEGRA